MVKWKETEETTLKQYIEKMVETRNTFSQSICNAAAICFAFPETDYHGDIIDPVAWSMLCKNSGGKIVYSWISTDDKILQASRQIVKYGKKPGTCDGGDLTPYITKYGRKYWLDDFVRIG